MNKRILELLTQVNAGTPESLWGRTDYIVMTEYEVERFAELLIDECCAALEHTERHRRDYFIAKIREHFEDK